MGEQAEWCTVPGYTDVCRRSDVVACIRREGQPLLCPRPLPDAGDRGGGWSRECRGVVYEDARDVRRVALNGALSAHGLTARQLDVPAYGRWLELGVCGCVRVRVCVWPCPPPANIGSACEAAASPALTGTPKIAPQHSGQGWLTRLVLWRVGGAPRQQHTTTASTRTSNCAAAMRGWPPPCAPRRRRRRSVCCPRWV